MRNTCFLIIFLLVPQFLLAQMERTRVIQNPDVEAIFPSSEIVGISTGQTLSGGDLNFQVMHNFGLVSTGIDELYGLDQGAVVRLGFNYGITDKWMIGIGRTNEEDLVDLSTSVRLISQKERIGSPVQVSFHGAAGIVTEEIRRFDDEFDDRLNYLGSLIFSRKFSEQFSFMISPMFAHFNTVEVTETNQVANNDFFATGIGAKYKLSSLATFSAEYLPVLSEQNSGTINHFAISANLDTGGHVFQLFFMSSRYFTEQQLIANTTEDFLSGDFRFGFTINRVFSL